MLQRCCRNFCIYERCPEGLWLVSPKYRTNWKCGRYSDVYQSLGSGTFTLQALKITSPAPAKIMLPGGVVPTYGNIHPLDTSFQKNKRNVYYKMSKIKKDEHSDVAGYSLGLPFIGAIIFFIVILCEYHFKPFKVIFKYTLMLLEALDQSLLFSVPL